MNDIGERQLQPGAIVPRMLPRYAHDSQAAQQIAALAGASRWRDVAEPAPADEETYDQQWQAPPWGDGIWDAYSDPAIFPQASPLEEDDGADVQPELPPTQPGAAPLRSVSRDEEIGEPDSRARDVVLEAAEPVGVRPAETETQAQVAAAPDHPGQPAELHTVQAHGRAGDAGPAMPASGRSSAATPHVPDIMPAPGDEPRLAVAASAPRGAGARRAGVADDAFASVAVPPALFATVAATAPERSMGAAATPAFVSTLAPLAAAGRIPDGVDPASNTPVPDRPGQPISAPPGQAAIRAATASQLPPANASQAPAVAGSPAAVTRPGAVAAGEARLANAPLVSAEAGQTQAASGPSGATRPIPPAAGESRRANPPLHASGAAGGRPWPTTGSLPRRLETTSRAPVQEHSGQAAFFPQTGPPPMHAGVAPQVLSASERESLAFAGLSVAPARPIAPASGEAQPAGTQMPAPDAVVAPLIAPSVRHTAVSTQPVQLKATVAAPASDVPDHSGPALPSQAAANNMASQVPAAAPAALPASALLRLQDNASGQVATDPKARTTNTGAATVGAKSGADSIIASASAAAPILPAPAIEFEAERNTNRMGAPAVAETGRPPHADGAAPEPTAAVQGPTESYASPATPSRSAPNAAQPTALPAIRSADPHLPPARIESFAGRPGGEPNAFGESDMHSLALGAAKAVPLVRPHHAPPETTTPRPFGAPPTYPSSRPTAGMAPRANVERTQAEPYGARNEDEARRSPAQTAHAHDEQPPHPPAMFQARPSILPAGSAPPRIGAEQVAQPETHPGMPSSALPASEASGRPHPFVRKDASSRSERIDARPAASSIAASAASELKPRPARPLDRVSGRANFDSMGTAAIAAATRQAAAAEIDLAAYVAQGPQTKGSAPSREAHLIAPPASRGLAAALRQIAPKASAAHVVVPNPIGYRPAQLSATRLSAGPTYGATPGRRSKVAAPASSLAPPTPPVSHSAAPGQAPPLQSAPGPRIRAFSPSSMTPAAASREGEASAPAARVRGAATAPRAVPVRVSREAHAVGAANGQTPAPAKSATKSPITPQPAAQILPRRASVSQDAPVTVRVNIGRIRIEGAPATTPQVRLFRRPAPALTLVQYAYRRGGRRP